MRSIAYGKNMALNTCHDKEDLWIGIDIDAKSIKCINVVFHHVKQKLDKKILAPYNYFMLQPGCSLWDKLSTYHLDKKYLNLFHLKQDRKSTRLNSSHVAISYAVFCLKK